MNTNTKGPAGMNAELPSVAELGASLKRATQVAVEAVINTPDAYSVDTMIQVVKAGELVGVSDFYLNPVREIIVTTGLED